MGDGVYTHGHHESVLRSHTWRTAANSAPNLLPHLRSGQSILDVGCGPGTITADLARIVAPGRVVGVDRSQAVVDLANADASGLDGVSFVVGDVYRLDFDADSFDVVHAHQVLQHLTDPVRALTEMRRVCRPDGIVAVRDGDYSSFAWAPLDPLLQRWLSLYQSVARHNGGEPDAGRFLLGWLQDAGFSDVRAGASVWCFSTPEDRAWWGGMWADRMRHSAIADQLIELGWSTERELEDIAAAFAAWADHAAGWFAVLHGEAFGTP